MKSPPKELVISSSSPSGSTQTILKPFLIWVLNNNLAAVDLPDPDVPSKIILALFLLFSFWVWYKNWLNRITPPDSSIPKRVELPGSLILSKTNGYIAAIVTEGIGVPILLSISCGGNIGKIDFNAFSCSNIKATARIPMASK